MTRLVLTRKRGEAIVIDGPVRLQIIEILPGRCKVVCEADKSVRIVREELLDREGEEHE